MTTTNWRAALMAVGAWFLVAACSRSDAQPAPSGTGGATVKAVTSTQGPGKDREAELGPYRIAPPGRVVAVGDLHGDVEAARAVLRLAGVLGSAGQWIGGNTTLVQTGDLLDRGDTEQELLTLLRELEPQARKAGGRLLVLNGNHETMNASGDFRYVTKRGFEAFQQADTSRFAQPVLEQLGAQARGRAGAFLPGGEWSRLLAEHPVIVVVGDTVFAHGGVLGSHVDYGIARLNDETSTWLRDGGRPLRAIADSDAPVWTRRFSDGQIKHKRCGELSEVLQRLKVKRMVVGHTVQKRINSACDGQVWRIDVGMSAYYGGHVVAALEIAGNDVRVLEANKP